MAVDFWILSVMAEQGDAAAQYCFGLLYQRGGVMYKGTKAVPQDMAEGLKWVRKAAEQGHAEAQFHLGVMHACGQGVPQDYVQAYTWFNAAAGESNINAKTFTKLIGELIQN